MSVAEWSGVNTKQKPNRVATPWTNTSTRVFSLFFVCYSCWCWFHLKIWWTYYGGSTKWLTVYSRQCRKKKLKAFAEYDPKQDTKKHLCHTVNVSSWYLQICFFFLTASNPVYALAKYIVCMWTWTYLAATISHQFFMAQFFEVSDVYCQNLAKRLNECMS